MKDITAVWIAKGDKFVLKKPENPNSLLWGAFTTKN